MSSEQRFYSALKDVFVGETLDGKSGFVNLMNLKSQYFAQIKPFIENKINSFTSDRSLRDEIFDKLFTFFESYFNETGTPFFYKTQIHKNIYEKVYSDREDVSLFWKTQKLYYVKSEANYKSIENLSVTSTDGLTRYFNFDATEIEHQKNNEKKSLSFYLIKVSKDKQTFFFKVRYEKKSDYDRIKKYLEFDNNDRVKKYILENYETISNSQIEKSENYLDKSCLSYKDDVYIRNLDNTLESVLVELSINKIENILKYFRNNAIICPENILKKAFSIYKKQNEVDYFVHKDAENFLKEQFDLYVYHYIFSKQNIISNLTQERINEIKIIKEIAYCVIEYIAKFENELKAIWEKAKFARKTNYVLTLDKLADNIELIKKIVLHKNFDQQIDEWKLLSEQWFDKNGKEFKKAWVEFDKAAKVDKNSIIKNGILNEEYKFFPIDTKYFEDLKFEILSNFDNLEEVLDGEAVKSDNWQALNTLKSRYKEKVQAIYIDPPFNTGSDFLYKDGYQNSTWLTIMDNRIQLAKDFLKDKGSFFLHLDEDANYLGKVVMNRYMNNYINEIIWHYRTYQGQVTDYYPKKHDTIYWYRNRDKEQFSLEYTDNYEGTVDYERWKSYIVNRNEIRGDNYPANDSRFMAYYNQWVEKHKRKPGKNDVILKIQGYVVDDTWMDVQALDPKNLDERFGSAKLTQKPELLLKRLINSASVNAKDYIMDFFGGSGTTAVTALKLNKKFLICDMGEHFYSALIPRLKRALIGDSTKLSKDVGWNGGGFFKYYELEQYEETLEKCSYTSQNVSLENFEKYSFNPDNEKMLSALELDTKKQKAVLNLDKLYSDIDIATTLSNVTGKFIKRLSAEKVVFEDNSEICLTDVSWENMKLIKPLIWWKN